MLQCIEHPGCSVDQDLGSDTAWNRRLGQLQADLCRLAITAHSTPQFLCEAAEVVRESLHLESVGMWTQEEAGGAFRAATVAGDAEVIRCLVDHDHDPAGILDPARFVARLHRRWKQRRPANHAEHGLTMLAAPLLGAGESGGAIAVCSRKADIEQLECAIEAVAGELSELLEPVRRVAANRESARMGDAMLRFASEAVIVADRSGNCARWNSAAESIFGWAACDVLGKPLSIVAPRSRDEFWTVYRRCVSEGSTARLHAHGQRWDGTPLSLAVHLAPMLDQQLGTSEVLLLVTDETHFVTMEQQLRLELEASTILARSESFHAAGPQLASLIGRRLESRFVDIWERPKDGCDWRIVAAWPSDAKSPQQSARQCRVEVELLALATRTREVLSLDADGSVIGQGGALSGEQAAGLHRLVVPVLTRDDCPVVLILGNPNQGGPHAALHRTLVSLAEKVSEAVARDRMKQLLRESEESLRQTRKMEAIGMLAGGIAHDFNNLLTVVLGNCELMLESDELESQAREFLGEIQTAGMRAASLTRQLLMFSRKRAPLPGLIDVRRQIRESCGMLKRVVGEQVVIETRIAPETYPIHMDPIELEQILLNLVVNARDAMPHGGNVTISTANVTLRARDVTHRQGVQPGDYIVVSVADNGGGMDEKTRARIFEPFFTTKDPGRGTGMGLATVYGIVSRCRGFIDVESRLGSGTRFAIVLPRAAIGIAPRQISDRPTEDPRGSETILVVEDEEVLRNLIRRILEVHGYTVLSATSGAAALQELEDNAAIDLVLSDVVMPELGGFALAGRMTAAGRKTPILLMSGYPDVAESERATDAEYPILAKPFTSDVLVRAVRDALNSRPVPLRS